MKSVNREAILAPSTIKFKTVWPLPGHFARIMSNTLFTCIYLIRSKFFFTVYQFFMLVICLICIQIVSTACRLVYLLYILIWFKLRWQQWIFNTQYIWYVLLIAYLILRKWRHIIIFDLCGIYRSNIYSHGT